MKAKEISEEKEAMAHYGSSDSGASLGDILGAAMRKAEGEETITSEVTDEKEEKLSDDTLETGDSADTAEENSPEELESSESKDASKA